MLKFTTFLPLGVLIVAGCATADGSSSGKVRSPLIDTRGVEIGYVDHWEDPSGSHIALRLRAGTLPAGKHGMHYHSVGRCDPPDFKSAGGHWNPTGKQHGHLNPAGPHVGDWGNLIVMADGDTTAGDPYPPQLTFADEDGTALVIHSGPDDERTDPSGNSGDRVACAVLAAPKGA